ncbi:MAG: hypothetical protein ING06_19280 [Roseomonas sp.]|nr:hypothetical protein [Roseomonas sp.]
MQRVNRSSAVATLPAAPAGGTPGYFTGGNPGLGQQATVPGFEWFNGVQEELIGMLTRAGLTPAQADLTQLRQSLDRLYGGGLRTVAANVTLTADDAGLVLVDAAGGARTVTLPDASAMGGRPIEFLFARTDTNAANAVTIQRTGTNLIEGAVSRGLLPGERMRMISDGVAGWRISGAAGRVNGLQVFSTAGTSVYTPTPGTVFVDVEAVGGGGGGGGAVVSGAGNCSAGLPGNAGSYGKSRFFSGFSGVTVTVGAGGAGGTGAAGGNGGTSSFGALMSCPGGPGGGPGAAQAGSASGANGNVSGVPSGANVMSARGGIGGSSFGQTTGQIAVSGFGGPSVFGPGGAPPATNLPGQPANAPGAGGSGTFGQQNSLALTGGNGAPGLVIVWEYA